MRDIDSTELYKRRVVALIDKCWTIKELAEKISEPYVMTGYVFLGTRKSLRIEEKMAKALCREHDFLFETAVRRRRVS